MNYPSSNLAIIRLITKESPLPKEKSRISIGFEIRDELIVDRIRLKYAKDDLR